MVNFFLKQWQELADIKEDLAKRDCFYATTGNLSIKITDEPLTFLITANGKDKRKREEDDFIVVNERGERVFSTDREPSVETYLHTEIYKRTNAGSIIHIHSVDNNLLTELYRNKGFVSFSNNEMVRKYFEGNHEEEDTKELTIPIVPNYHEHPFMLEAVLPLLEKNVGAFFIENHGITVWAKTPQEAKKRLEAIEFLCSYTIKLKLLQRSLQGDRM